VSVETGSGAEVGAWPGSGLERGGGGASRAWFGVRRRGLAGWIAEVRGPAACLRRDGLFRRALLVADVLALVGAFVLAVELARRSLGLTWVGFVLVPVSVALAKASGLYDRDELCFLYTSDAADDLLCVALGGRRIINKTTPVI